MAVEPQEEKKQEWAINLYYNIDMEIDCRLGFMSDVPSQLPEASQGWAFLIALVGKDDQQQIPDQPGKQLEQDAVLVSGDEVILKFRFQLTAEAVDTAREQTRVRALRGADAIHLASALLLQRRFEDDEEQVIFVTSDRELKEAAQSVGFTVRDPNEEESPSSEPRENEEEIHVDE